MNSARASITLGSPRAIRQVPRGTSIGANTTTPSDTRHGHGGARRHPQHELVGAELQGAGRQREAQPGPGGLDVGGVVAAAHGGGEGGVVDAAPGVGERGHGEQHRGHDPQNTQRHDRFVVSQAEMGAPSSEGSTHAAET